jgi:hypothetical protein
MITKFDSFTTAPPTWRTSAMLAADQRALLFMEELAGGTRGVIRQVYGRAQHALDG